MNIFQNVRLLLTSEISLEGLDGITLQALWLRISEETRATLPFPHTLEEEYWDIIRQIPEFSFYELEEPRPDLIPYDRFMYCENDADNSFYEPEDVPEDIYTHKVVNDIVHGIRGSCATYYSRKNITNQARLTEYDEARERWGSRLVIVASQECRENALTGRQSSGAIDLSPMQYCILERIGRSRYQGEITQGKRSLQVLGEDPKSLFYHRKTLLKHRLITKQIYYQKSGAQNFSGSLLHLQRYYTERKSKHLTLTEQIVEYLRGKPNYYSLYSDVTTTLHVSGSAKKLFKSPEFQRFVKTEMIPYKEYYPNSSPAQWKLKNSNKEKTVRVMKLLDPEIDVTEHWYKYDEAEEDEEGSGYQNYENLCYGVSLLAQAAAVVRMHGGNGCCQTELGEIMGLNKLGARSFCRNLLRRNIVTCVMNDVGRQRVTRFVSRKFENKGQMTLQFKMEREKMMSLISTKNDSTFSFDDVSTGSRNSEATENLDETSIHDSPAAPSGSSTTSCTPVKREFTSLLGISPEFVNVDNLEANSEPPKKTAKIGNDDNKNTGSTDGEVGGRKRPAESVAGEEEVEKKRKIEVESQSGGKKDIDNIEVKMVVTESEPGLKGYSQGFEEQLKREVLNTSSLDTNKVTYRLLRRANFIIESIRQEKVIADLTKLMKMIQDDENDEGYKVKIDKKSFIRLLLKLAKDGHVKYMKATLTSGTKTKSISFICDPSINENHSVIQSALEQAKMKFFIGALALKGPGKGPEGGLAEDVKEINSGDLSDGKKEKCEYNYDKSAARKYGFCPKFVRMRIIHELLFYLIYDEIAEPISKPEELRHWLLDKDQPPDQVDDLSQEMSPVFYPGEICWKTFISPIPSHTNWPRGWTLICDVLLRLPLKLFVQCCNVSYEIPGIDDYLKHPVKKYFLVRNLPPKIRNGLMIKRKYIFCVHEIISRLCYCGLVQFGPQRLKEKDQIFVYLNRKTSLLNTVTSKAGYHEISAMEYEKHSYYFENFRDIEQYWYELWTTCMNTNLGGRLCVTGKYIVLEQLHTKSDMLAAVQPKMPEEATLADNGDIPGDRRGAAGLDSAIFAHLKRNWNWQSSDEIFGYPSKPSQEKRQGSRETIRVSNPKNPEEVLELSVKKHVVSGGARNLNKGRKSGGKGQEEAKLQGVPKQDSHELHAVHVQGVPDRPRKYKIRQKTIVRKVVAKRRLRKPFYDEVDKQALKKMAKLRTDWSPLEDHVLLLCTVGSQYLCPNRHRQIISFAVIRDVLHKLVPGSACKTSRACQRRIIYIMKNCNTRRSVQMCLEEIRQHETITEKYKSLCKRTQNSQVPEPELNIAFVELVWRMSKIFSTLIKPEKTPIKTIPATVKRFKDCYHICGTKKAPGFYREPLNIHDINFNVIKTVVHSSMCTTKDKTSWAYQLFKVYQQYPESLLRAVITRTRHEQMISLKKSYVKSHKIGGQMPLSSSPYQLSISYKYQLLCKYPFALFQEAYEVLRNTAGWLTEVNFNEDSIGKGLEVKCPKSGTAAGIMELYQKTDVRFNLEIPEDVIVLDQNIQNDSAYDRIIKRYYNILRDPSSFHTWEEKKRQKTDSDDEDNYPSIEIDEESMQKSNTETPPVFPRPNTRIAFYMMRAEMCEGLDEKTTQHMHDFFVVNACKVFIHLPSLLATATDFNAEKLCADYQEIQSTIGPEILTAIKRAALIPNKCGTECELLESLSASGANDSDILFAKTLTERIEQNGILGATINELKLLMPNPYEGNLMILDILDILTNLKIVIQTGIETIRYVHFDHKKPWIINSLKILRLDREKIQPATSGTIEHLSEKLFRHKKSFSSIELQKSKQRLDLTSQQQIKVLMSPWIRIDGTLNRRVLDRWLGSILLACLDQPGITLELLIHKFQYVKPVETITLIKYLTKLKCVQQTVVCKSKVTLFTGVPTLTTVPATGLEDPKDVIVEPLCNAVTKLAVFIGEKAYSTDFLL